MLDEEEEEDEKPLVELLSLLGLDEVLVVEEEAASVKLKGTDWDVDWPEPKKEEEEEPSDLEEPICEGEGGTDLS